MLFCSRVELIKGVSFGNWKFASGEFRAAWGGCATVLSLFSVEKWEAQLCSALRLHSQVNPEGVWILDGMEKFLRGFTDVQMSPGIPILFLFLLLTQSVQLGMAEPHPWGGFCLEFPSFSKHNQLIIVLIWPKTEEFCLSNQAQPNHTFPSGNSSSSLFLTAQLRDLGTKSFHSLFLFLCFSVNWQLLSRAWRSGTPTLLLSLTFSHPTPT